MKPKKGKENKMNELAIRTESDIKEMAAILATFPEPGKWTQEQKNQAVNFAALLDTAQKMIAAKTLAGIDYGAEKEMFLNNAGRTDSKHTHRSYRSALSRLEAYAERAHISPLELTPARADDFIYSLKGEAAAASVRRDVAACSSFFTWLERRHEGIKNPFRGTKARPAEKTEKALVIPTAPEVKKIIAALPLFEAAAVSVMAFRGLRIGGLPGLEINGSRFKTRSKGKDISGELPGNALAAIKAANAEEKKRPFAGITEEALARRIEYHIGKLHKAKKIKAAYSCHSFRHFFAVTEWGKDKDIKRIQKLLAHSGIQVTDRYLRSLGIRD
jgi:site-specific recombinase XerD